MNPDPREPEQKAEYPAEESSGRFQSISRWAEESELVDYDPIDDSEAYYASNPPAEDQMTSQERNESTRVNPLIDGSEASQDLRVAQPRASPLIQTQRVSPDSRDKSSRREITKLSQAQAFEIERVAGRHRPQAVRPFSRPPRSAEPLFIRRRLCFLTE